MSVSYVAADAGPGVSLVHVSWNLLRVIFIRHSRPLKMGKPRKEKAGRHIWTPHKVLNELEAKNEPHLTIPHQGRQWFIVSDFEYFEVSSVLHAHSCHFTVMSKVKVRVRG